MHYTVRGLAFEAPYWSCVSGHRGLIAGGRRRPAIARYVFLLHEEPYQPLVKAGRHLHGAHLLYWLRETVPTGPASQPVALPNSPVTVISLESVLHCTGPRFWAPASESFHQTYGGARQIWRCAAKFGALNAKLAFEFCSRAGQGKNVAHHVKFVAATSKLFLVCRHFFSFSWVGVFTPIWRCSSRGVSVQKLLILPARPCFSPRLSWI